MWIPTAAWVAPGRARDEADPGPAGELAVRLGHVRGGRLVPGGDQPDRRVADRVEDVDVALAGDAIGRVHAVDEQLVDEDARGGAHQNAIGYSPYTVGRWSFGRSSSAGST